MGMENPFLNLPLYTPPSRSPPGIDQNNDPPQVYMDNCRDLGIVPNQDFIKALRSDHQRNVVADAEVGPRHLAAFTRSLAGAKAISLLKLTNNDIGDEGALALARALLDNAAIRRIYLKSNKFSPNGIIQIAEGIKANNHLTEITIIDNRVGDQGCCALADALIANLNIETVVIQGCQIANRGAEAIGAMLKVNTALVKLELDSNLIGADGAAGLANGLASNRTLAQFSVSGNPLTNAGLFSLSRFLPRFSVVDLTSCQIGPHGADSLTQAFMSQPNCITAVLSLDKNRIASVGALSLARCLHCLPRLEELRIADNKIGSKGCFGLSHAAAMHPSLRRVFLSDNIISDDGAVAMAECFKTNSQLQLISLHHNYVTEQGEYAIVDSLESQVNTTGQIDVSHQQERDLSTLTLDTEEQFFNVRDDLCVKIAEVWKAYADRCQATGRRPNDRLLQTFNGLRGDSVPGQDLIPTAVHLNHQKIGSYGAWAIAEVLVLNSTITDLSLADNEIGPDGAAALSNVISRNPTIKRLELQNNLIGSQGAASLAHAFSGTQCQINDLNLESNDIKDDGASAIFKSMLNDSCALSVLNLGDNGIGYEGSLSCANVLRVNSKINRLYLDNNPLGDDGIRALVNPLRDFSKGLEILSLKNTSCGRVCGRGLGEALSTNNVLQELYLDSNKLGDLGASSLSKALRHNSTLRVLSLRRNQIDPIGVSELRNAVNNHPSLKELVIEESGPSGDQYSPIKSPSSADKVIQPRSPVSFDQASFAERPYDELRVDVGPVLQSPSLGSSKVRSSSQLQDSKVFSLPAEASSPSSRRPLDSPSARRHTPLDIHDIHSPVVDQRAAEKKADEIRSTLDGIIPDPSQKTEAQRQLAELAAELAAINRHLQSLNKRRDHLIALCRAAQEKEFTENFQQAKANHLMSLRSNSANLVPLPQLKPVTTEERMIETNLGRSFSQRLEQQEREVEATIANLDGLARNRNRLDAQIHQHIQDLGETERLLKQTMSSGDRDMLDKAEALSLKRRAIEEASCRDLKQKKIVTDQLLEENKQLQLKLQELIDIKTHRMNHLGEILSGSGGDARPVAFQQAIINLQKVLELRSVIAEAEKEEEEAVGNWNIAKENLNKSRMDLREKEKQEERGYIDAQRFRQSTQECWKTEEMFRTKIALPFIATEETKNLIPIAQERFQFYSPLMIESNEIERSLAVSEELLSRFQDELKKISNEKERRDACMDELREFNRLKEELDRKREFLRQWNGKISSLSEAQKTTDEDKLIAMANGDFAEFKKAEGQSQRLDSTVKNLKENRLVLSREIEEIEIKAESMFHNLQEKNADFFVELLLVNQAEKTAKETKEKIDYPSGHDHSSYSPSK